MSLLKITLSFRQISIYSGATFLQTKYKRETIAMADDRSQPVVDDKSQPVVDDKSQPVVDDRFQPVVDDKYQPVVVYQYKKSTCSHHMESLHQFNYLKQ